MNVLVYGLLLGLQIVLTFPRFVRTCEGLDLYRFGVYGVHHMLDVFLFWSPFFLQTRVEFLVHLLVAIGVVLHWATYNNRCIATVYLNRLCGYPEEMWLDAIQNRLGLRRLSEYFQTIWIGAVIAYDVMEILT